MASTITELRSEAVIKSVFDSTCKVCVYEAANKALTPDIGRRLRQFYMQIMRVKWEAIGSIQRGMVRKVQPCSLEHHARALEIRQEWLARQREIKRDAVARLEEYRLALVTALESGDEFRIKKASMLFRQQEGRVGKFK